MHFSDFEDKSYIADYNMANMVVIHLFRKERIVFNRICTFPYCILVIVIADSTDSRSFIRSTDNCFFHRLEANRFYFIPPGHSVEYNLQTDVQYYTFHVGFERFPEIDFYNSDYPCLTGDAGNYLRELSDIWSDNDALRQACRIRLLLLGFFLAHWPDSSRLESIPKKLQTFIAGIQASCDAKTTVDKLAEDFCMHPDSFSRYLKKYLKMTAKEYITHILLRKIMAMLTDSRITLRVIAEHFSFSSEYYLSRFVKKNLGVSPKFYRTSFFKHK